MAEGFMTMVDAFVVNWDNQQIKDARSLLIRTSSSSIK